MLWSFIIHPSRFCALVVFAIVKFPLHKMFKIGNSCLSLKGIIPLGVLLGVLLWFDLYFGKSVCFWSRTLEFLCWL